MLAKEGAPQRELDADDPVSFLVNLELPRRVDAADIDCGSVLTFNLTECPSGGAELPAETLERDSCCIESELDL